MVRSVLLTVGLCCLRSIGLVYFTVDEIRLFGLIFLAYLVFLLTVPSRLEIGFGLLCLRFPHRKSK